MEAKAKGMGKKGTSGVAEKGKCVSCSPRAENSQNEVG